MTSAFAGPHAGPAGQNPHANEARSGARGSEERVPALSRRRLAVVADLGGVRRRVEDLFREHSRDVLAYTLRHADAATTEGIVSEIFVVASRPLDRRPADLQSRDIAARLCRTAWQPAAVGLLRCSAS
jgi:hypothetical protein